MKILFAMIVFPALGAILVIMMALAMQFFDRFKLFAAILGTIGMASVWIGLAGITTYFIFFLKF